jgi:threonine dehydrogenase-like Zn-dependent dehydrogenase
MIRAIRSLISTGTELTCYSSNFAPGTHWANWVQYPFPPGYSHVGEVIAVGEDVADIVAGARVATRSNHREYVTCPAGQAVKIPAGVSDEDATWFGIASIVQNGVRRAGHELGDVVVVVGLGMLGQLAVQYVRLIGASEVIAVDLSAARLEMAAAHGANHTLQMSVQDALPEIERITHGRRADRVYDVTGHAPVFQHALTLVRNGGRLVLLGDSGAPSEQRLAPDLITRGLTVVGAHDSNAPGAPTNNDWWTNRHMQPLFFKYLERGQMRVSDLVTKRYSPRDAGSAYADLLADRSSAMGVLFDWSQLSAE